MELNSILLFFLAVIPLVCTPGPDIIFVASQGAMKGRQASLRAVAGGDSVGYGGGVPGFIFTLAVCPT
jgi:threonine/homoserine/homoserine lactone efflux protein